MMLTRNQLDPFTPSELAAEPSIEDDDATAAERIGVALTALRGRSHLSEEEWASALGVDEDTLLLMERAQLLDQPTASFLLRAAMLCGGKLKISFGRGERAIEI